MEEGGGVFEAVMNCQYQYIDYVGSVDGEYLGGISTLARNGLSVGSRMVLCTCILLLLLGWLEAW